MALQFLAALGPLLAKGGSAAAGLLGQAGSGLASTGGQMLGKSLVSELLGGGGGQMGMLQAPQIGTPDINTDFSQNRLNRRFM